jgi:hypothetical protein
MVDRAPKLFISHKHIQPDAEIAKRVADFLNEKSGFVLNIHLSSDPEYKGPRIGRTLNEERRRALCETDALILIYTSAGHNWAYCMWECGPATDPQTPETNIYVLQCGVDVPQPFADTIRINARKQDDFKRFVQSFLKDPNFFPLRGKAINDKVPDQTCDRYAQELFDKLSPVLPQDGNEPEPWPSYPYLTLSIDLDQVDRICSATAVQSVELTKEVVESAAIVTKGDAEAGRLFGKRAPIDNIDFKGVLSRWKQAYPASEAKWFDAICSRIASAARDEFPTLVWELMRAMDKADGTWYAPALIQTQNSPRQHTMNFDICFLKFALDENNEPIIGVPKV